MFIAGNFFAARRLCNPPSRCSAIRSCPYGPGPVGEEPCAQIHKVGLYRKFLIPRLTVKPGGRLLFVEHGLSPEPGVCKWQNRLDPLWVKVSGGCHLNRPIEPLITAAGFDIDRLQTGYMAGPRLMTFMHEGVARPQ